MKIKFKGGIIRESTVGAPLLGTEGALNLGSLKSKYSTTLPWKIH
jgi:hypothetical protein